LHTATAKRLGLDRSEPVELNESLRAAVAVLAEAHERAEPEFVGVAAMWLDVITNLCGRESR
jgi:hypothetical protein